MLTGNVALLGVQGKLDQTAGLRVQWWAARGIDVNLLETPVENVIAMFDTIREYGGCG
jgi:hypothetical protein